MRCLLKEGIVRAIQSFEWRFLAEAIESGFEEDFLPACKLIPIAIRRRPDLLIEFFQGGVVAELVRIGEVATFPVKKWAFRSLALLIEISREITILELLQTKFIEQLADLLDGSAGKLLEYVLRCILDLTFAIERFGMVIVVVFQEFEIFQKVSELRENLTPMGEVLRNGILGLLPSFLSEFGALEGESVE
jgi:hypothetical protein